MQMETRKLLVAKIWSLLTYIQRHPLIETGVESFYTSTYSRASASDSVSEYITNIRASSQQSCNVR